MTHDIHRTLGLAALAILNGTQAAEDRLTPAQREEMRHLIEQGAKFALFITNDGRAVTAELAVIAKEAPAPFDRALLRLAGPIEAAAAPPGSVQVVDRMRLD